MPRGINWDELPNNFAKFRPSVVEEEKKEDKAQVFEPKEFNLQQDSLLIGKRIGFGVIVSNV